MLQEKVPAIKIYGIDQPLDGISDVVSITIDDTGWSIAFQVLHPGSAKKVIREGFTKIAVGSPEYAALAKPDAAIATAYKALLPAMIAKLGAAPAPVSTTVQTTTPT